MKLSATILILTSVLFIASCVPSLNPFYTESDLTMDATLIGTWVEKENGESWTFSLSEKLKYTVVHIDGDGRKAKYDARLMKLEDKLFIDIVPVKSEIAQNDTFRDRLIATHTLLHIVNKGSVVEISYMEPRWLKDHLRENPAAIRHDNVAGEIVLSSSPKETQKFILANMGTRNAFSQPAEFVRKRGGS